MDIKTITNLIIKEKKDYFEEKYNSPFFRSAIKEISKSFSEREALFTVFPLSFISVALPFGFISFLFPTLSIPLFLFFSITIFTTGLFLFCKTKEKRIIKKVEEDENERNEYLNYIIMPYFEKELISDEILTHIKLKLTLDQFKILKAMNKDGITYKGLSDFIENIKDIDSSIEESESEKYSLKYSDIKNTYTHINE